MSYIILVLLFLLNFSYIIPNYNTNDSVNMRNDQSISDSINPGSIHSSPQTRAGHVNTEVTLLTYGKGEKINGDFGFALIGLGDINSDGFDDIVVSAPNANPGSNANAGEVYIFYGEEDFVLDKINADDADIVISNNVPNEHFGWSLCMPGDINDDEINDLMIGAPGSTGNTGKIYVYYSSTITASSEISASAADIIIQGSSTGDFFGSNIVALNDVNSDQDNDIIVGAPGSDKAYIIYGPTFGSSDRTTIIGPKNSQFGTAVSGGTDLNGDGNSDYVVSAPVGIPASGLKGQVFLYFGDQNFYNSAVISKENNTIVSNSLDDKFGQCLNSQIDIDLDGLYDIIVGAPGEDAVYIYYGKSLIEQYIYPYLWNMPGDPLSPVGFSSGVYNDVGQNVDVNTYGLDGDDDGWDWASDVFGTSTGTDMDHIYAAREDSNPPYADAEGLDYYDDGKLEVIVGRSNTQLGPSWNPGWWNQNPIISDSGSWGIEFTVSQSMYENISLGAEVILELDWEAHDAMEVFGNSGGTEERCYIKVRFSSSTTSTYLGTDIGGDSTAELYFFESSTVLSTPFESDIKHFKTNINDLIESSGSFYLEMGARLETTYASNKGQDEGFVAFFDNISIRIETLPITHNVKIKGVGQSQFGYMISAIDDLNDDGFDEIAIGAPYSNLGGTSSGAVYILYGNSVLLSQMNSNEVNRIIIGYDDNERFGLMIGSAGDVNGDNSNDFLIGATGFSDNLGKAYVFSLAQKPTISLYHPRGGAIIDGEIDIISNVTDSENELDKFGVRFYYSKVIKNNGNNWKLINQETIPISNIGTAPDIKYQFATKWNTTSESDGLYQIKAVVMDNSYLSSEIISEYIEINNPDKPVVEILSPDLENNTYTGNITIKANCYDLDGDLSFVSFYFSEDGKNWNLIGTEYSGIDSVYQLEWETNELTDGFYIISVRANDSIGLSTGEISVWFKIHNPGAPSISFLKPSLNDILEGFAILQVSVKDKDNNIASPGVTFSYSRNRNDWVSIDSVAVANEDNSYSINWYTLLVKDGYYYLKAYVEDTTNLFDETILGPIEVDNPSPPKIQLTPLNQPVSGKIILSAVCSDDDSDISSEGVVFYNNINDGSWKEIGKVLLHRGIISGQNIIFNLEWNTATNETKDSPNYKFRAMVKDITGKINESIIGPIEINNPDSPTISLDSPKKNEKLSGNINLGAYAEDPDNDIDSRGVTFYFSLDGIKWHLLDNQPKPVSNSTLYQYQWNTAKLPNGNYYLKAEVVDQTALMAESVVKIKINNPTEDSILNVSGTFCTVSIILIIIIIILAAFVILSIIKRRKKLRQLETKKEREELVKSIREEVIREARRYPMISTSQPYDIPELSRYSQGAAAQTPSAKLTTPDYPMLPPFQGELQEEPPSPGVPVPTGGPYIQSQAAPTTEPYPPPVQDVKYQPKIGLTPDDMASTKKNGESQQNHQQSPPQAQAQPQVQAQQQPQAQPQMQAQPPTQAQPQPQIQPQPQPQVLDTPPVTPKIKKDDEQGGESA